MSNHQKRQQNKNSRNLDYQNLERRQMLATITVTTFDDVVDPNDGVLSLRESIIDSNNNSQDDTILLMAGTYSVSVAGIGEDLGLTGDFDITPDGGRSLTIKGQGNNETIVDGNQIDRVFQVHLHSNVQLEDLMTFRGKVNDPVNIGRRGAGIWSAHSTLTLDNVSISDNDSGSFGVGGGLWIAGGSFSINDSSFTNNHVSRNGSAVFSRGATGSIDFATMTHNTNFGRSGGLIYLMQSDLELRRSRIDENPSGGVIVAIESNVNVFHTRFRENGIGVFSGRDTIIADDSTVDIDDSRFVRNGSIAISFQNAFRDLTVTDSVFIENETGGIDFNGQNLSVINSSFLGEKNISDPFHGESEFGIRAVSERFNPDLEDPATIFVQNSSFEKHKTSAIQIDSDSRPAFVMLDGVISKDNRPPERRGSSIRIVCNDIQQFESITIKNTRIEGTGGGVWVNSRGG